MKYTDKLESNTKKKIAKTIKHNCHTRRKRKCKAKLDLEENQSN